MYLSRGKFSGTAMARYHGVDIASRIEGATPHQLVQIMYEELLKSLDAMAFAASRGDYVKRGQHQSKTLAILTALETSLDFEKGGEIASGLVTVYREGRRLVVAGGREGDAQPLLKAREMLGEIASAWEAIGRNG
ncbi:MAG TPA: flagellar protein FliS [Allosphingosinicella sp.]|nr:flagellar protein FliS [Allosphingosinicella sp.]